eukprot:TRINITY_DN2890_c0_g1_i1.p1 TRINITY_DN2890_c0_g1~~TRINITY_DN2890_c0_g1_i1.p1  ORF type:complete len:301 (-),score=58.79 TRINITY_DN2890_c0_g1_i1:21-923(-)
MYPITGLRVSSFGRFIKCPQATPWYHSNQLLKISQHKFHSTALTLRKIDRYSSRLQNDPRIKGLMKKHEAHEAFLKDTKAQQEEGRKIKDEAGLFLLPTTNKIVDPGLIPKKRLSLFSYAGIVEVGKRTLGTLQTFAIHPIRMRNLATKKKFSLKGCSRAEIKGMVQEYFMKFHKDTFEGDVQSLSRYTGDKLYKEITGDIARLKTKTLDIKWECQIYHMKIRSFRTITAPPPISGEFVQVVYTIVSAQTHEIVDKRTREVKTPKGDPTWVISHWGFEKRLDLPDSKWLLIERFEEDEYN